jgi:hypothetical protein
MDRASMLDMTHFYIHMGDGRYRFRLYSKFVAMHRCEAPGVSHIYTSILSDVFATSSP